jgi:hypothetical protein
MQDPTVVFSFGMGVESAAIWRRWYADITTRALMVNGQRVPFDFKNLIIVTSQVGSEQPDTIRDMEKYVLPEWRDARVRFVELARAGHLEKDGIVVLQDTRNPVRLHQAGRWKLMDEMLMAGTVPQYAGEHRCALKFKAFVIETWMAYEFQKRLDAPVLHVWGYNADEPSRIRKSDMHVRAHNAEREVLLPERERTPLLVFGFNAAEPTRIERAAKYDGPHRIGCYPLAQWQWDRQCCVDYLRDEYGIVWQKSACGFCPFCEENYKQTPAGIDRMTRHADDTIAALLMEHVSLCFNTNGQLYRDTALWEIVKKHIPPVWEMFEVELSARPWALYEVRRVFNASAEKTAERKAAGKGPKVMVARSVRPLASGTRVDM